jgi:CRP/FNR family transcriptional regulator
LKFVRHLSLLLQKAEIRMAELVHKSVPERLASHIVRLVESEGVMTKEGLMVPTRYTHEHLGTMIGCKRVAVTRAFNFLRQEGVLELKLRKIYIRDNEALERIASAQR